jgi:hypothetical protein
MGVAPRNNLEVGAMRAQAAKDYFNQPRYRRAAHFDDKPRSGGVASDRNEPRGFLPRSRVSAKVFGKSTRIAMITKRVTQRLSGFFKKIVGADSQPER